jgi:4-hydroxybutyrate CoA-transferase
MQLGIGAIPDAVLKFLHNKKDLGVHSELFSDGVIDLVNAGVLTNARKTLHPGKIIAGFMLGTQTLYEWADDNPLIELHRTEYVNDPFVIAQNERMVAINSAIEVDLTGQVCADSIGPKLYSGVGGQLDFIYGASRSKGRRADHRTAQHNHPQRRYTGHPHCRHAQAGRRCGDQPQPRPLCGDRIWRG